MKHPEQIVHLAAGALALEDQPADAAALLVEAAAMNALECGLSLDDLIARLRRSHATLAAAKEAVEAHPGNASFLKQ